MVERADEPLRWLRAGRHDLGPLTGQDTRVLLAIDACWQAYAVAGDGDREHLFAAVVELLRVMQPKCWWLAVELVARALDWSDREEMRRQLLQYTAPDHHHFLPEVR